MAILKNSPFGEIRGKLGNFIIKRMNGKTIISQRPDKYPKSNDPVVLARRKRFAAASIISSCLSKNPLMKVIWRNSDYKKTRTAYNMMFQKFYNHVSETDIDKEIRLSPDFGDFCFQLKNVSMNEDSLSVIFNPVNKKLDLNTYANKAEYIQMVAIIKFKDTYQLSGKPFLVNSVMSNKVQITDSEEINLYYDFCDTESRRLQELNCDRLLLVLVALDKDLNPIASSSTYDFDIEWLPFNKNISES